MNNEQPTPLLEVYRAINKVQEAMSLEGISKDRRNQQQGYAFRGIDDCYAALAPHLAAQKLCIIPRYVKREVVEQQSKAGGILFYVTIEGEFDFVSAIDGSRHTARMFGEAMDSADKATNKAASAAFKYLLLQTFCIPTEGDNDADSVTPEPVNRPAAKTADVVSSAPKGPTEEQWKRFVASFNDTNRPMAVAYFQKKHMLPMHANAVLEELPLECAPATNAQYISIMAEIQSFMDGDQKGEDWWRSVKVPFGNHKAKTLEELDKKVLFGFWANFEVSTSYNGNAKSQAQIDEENQFRQALDEAGEHYDFGSHGD